MAEKNERAYEKVIEHIKNEIWQGSLKRGERLPRNGSWPRPWASAAIPCGRPSAPWD